VNAVEVVGREAELRSVYGFLDRAVDGPAAFVLEGEAGIGKSTLWLAAVTGARERGLTVLSARPAEAERGLAHVGLGDLFDDVLDDVLPELLTPRRRALEIALLREDGSDETVDQRALVVAVRDVLQLLSDQRPLLLAIDDVPWLDASSSSALAFALRRLGDSRVRVLLARRRASNVESSELERALPDERVEHLRVGALSVGALHRLLRDRLGRTFARQTLLRIHECSGGNPFFALELAGAFGADIDPLAPLEVPQSLDELVRARIAALPAATREALALASALGAPSESLLERAGVGTGVLAPATAAHVIERDDGVIRFTHPLLSSVLYRDMGEERRAVHARIAAIVDDPVLRARHLALSSDAPNPEIAGVLDEAAAVAGDRGAAAVAAELAEHARRLTPTESRDDNCRRSLAAARAHRAAGEWTHAKTIASDLLIEIGPGALRAEALLLLAEFEGLDRAVALLEEALREATEQPALQATVHSSLALATRFKKGFAGALGHARAALDLADDLDDDAMRVAALIALAFLGYSVGDADAPGHATRAYELATVVGDVGLLSKATDVLGGVLIAQRDLDAARALLEHEYDLRRERDELLAADALHRLAWVELWGGRWQLAADYAERANEIQVQYGLEVPWVHLPIAAIAVHRGQLEVARTHSERALQLGEEQFGFHTPVHLGILGIAARQSGDPHTATEWFAEAAAVTKRLGWREASQRWWIADQVEALLELDRVDEAVHILDAWQADAQRHDHKWMLAHATRCHGLVAAARGAVEESASLLEDAVAQHEHAADRFGRARALLALGVVRRRERQKRAARDTIGTALDEFEQLGAGTWVEKARAELGHIGGRTRVEGLTPAERRVAALVAEARTNREVAAALSVGERTVETHLSRVYAKLGVRSRAELARRFRPDGQSSGELTISS
jgi:DNA-binding CsgD family transcriptional regulator